MGYINMKDLKDLFDYVEYKEIKLKLSKESLEQLMKDLSNLKYLSPKDYYFIYDYVGNNTISTMIHTAMCVKSEKLFKDPQVKELLLEYLI